VLGVSGEVEVVDGDVAALSEVFEGDGAADAGGATGYGGGLIEEKVMGHSCRGGLSEGCRGVEGSCCCSL